MKFILVIRGAYIKGSLYSGFYSITQLYSKGIDVKIRESATPSSPRKAYETREAQGAITDNGIQICDYVVTRTSERIIQSQ